MNENLHGRAVLPGLRRMLLALAGTLFLLPGSAQSQSTVSGIVTDASGEGIAGVAVIVKGTTTGTSTDMKGAYTIRASKSDVLVFSFLGYKTQEVAVHNRMEIDVRLESDAQLVDEVVVVGYGVQKKSLVTGAISSVKGSALETTGIMRADDALAGKQPAYRSCRTPDNPDRMSRFTSAVSAPTARRHLFISLTEWPFRASSTSTRATSNRSRC